ncbi:MAG: hypothetical protein RIC12_01720 [Pirellulales bacterium]
MIDSMAEKHRKYLAFQLKVVVVPRKLFRASYSGSRQIGLSDLPGSPAQAEMMMILLSSANCVRPVRRATKCAETNSRDSTVRFK